MRIKMAKTLYPDEVYGINLGKPGTMLELDQVYACWVSIHGAVAGWCDNGERLGVKPGEFDVVEWHETKPCDHRITDTERLDWLLDHRLAKCLENPVTYYPERKDIDIDMGREK
jgi:hypothetical protein